MPLGNCRLGPYISVAKYVEGIFNAMASIKHFADELCFCLRWETWGEWGDLGILYLRVSNVGLY